MTGPEVKRLREWLKLTRTELGEKLMFHAPYHSVWMIETGRRNMGNQASLLLIHIYEEFLRMKKEAKNLDK